MQTLRISKVYTGAVTGKDTPSRPKLPSPQDVAEVLGFVPLLEVYFRRCLQVEMPAQLQEFFGQHRLTGRHGGVLAQLSAGQSISVTELARRMGVSLSTASELVGDLARAGLVERRRTLAGLAEPHRATVQAFVAQRAGPLLQVLEALSPRDRQGFARGLSAWAQQVRDW
jgi:DNA-binding MarR family transcriptional regulator